jgi:hypothetical protein
MYTDLSVSEPLATAFGSNARAFAGDYGTEYGGYTSFVQHRGSIPVMWHQEVNQMTPRPPIESQSLAVQCGSELIDSTRNRPVLLTSGQALR